MEKELQRIGLSSNQVKVYLALLKLGSTKATALIEQTKLHRNIVYENLEKLVDFGLASFVLIRGIKHFEPTSPSRLEEWVEKQKQEALEKESIVDSLLPQIEKLRKTVERKQEAKVFRGKHGVRTIIEEIPKAKGEVLLLATGWGFKQTLGSYFSKWHQQLRKNKVKCRMIVPTGRDIAGTEPFVPRFINETQVIPSTIIVFEDNVLNIVWGEDPIAVLITSEKAAESYKKYFELIWKTARA